MFDPVNNFPFPVVGKSPFFVLNHARRNPNAQVMISRCFQHQRKYLAADKCCPEKIKIEKHILDHLCTLEFQINARVQINVWDAIFAKNNKRTGPNKHAGWEK